MPVSVQANADGRLEIFAQGRDDNIWQNAQTVAGGPNWSGWANIGGGGGGTPVVGRNQDGRLEVFDTNNSHNTWHAWQTVAGGAWTPMQDLGGIPPAGGTSLGSLLTAELNSNGSLQIFGYAPQPNANYAASVWTNWQAAGGWSGWTLMGRWNIFGDPCVTTYSDGAVVAFAQSGGGPAPNQIWYSQQTTPGINSATLPNGYPVTDGSWSVWSPLSNNLPVPSLAAFITAGVGQNDDGTLQVFVIDTGGQLWSIQQTGAGSGEPWATWGSLGSPANVQLVGTPSVESNQDGRLELFAKGTDDNAWHIWQTAPNGGWSGWALLTGVGGGAPSTARNSNGCLELFAINNSGNCWHIWQTTAGGGWSAMTDLGQPSSTGLVP